MTEIKLSQGKVALVDDEDSDFMCEFRWSAANQHGYWYAVSRDNNVSMHRLIMDAPPGSDVDHINGNGLDNRRENLRICNRSENARNSYKRKKNKSGFKGVYWDGSHKAWRAEIGINYKSVRLGDFPTPKDAARAYDAAARRLHGEFARPNFPSG